jgi:hypothetical protein
MRNQERSREANRLVRTASEDTLHPARASCRYTIPGIEPRYSPLALNQGRFPQVPATLDAVAAVGESHFHISRRVRLMRWAATTSASLPHACTPQQVSIRLLESNASPNHRPATKQPIDFISVGRAMRPAADPQPASPPLSDLAMLLRRLFRLSSSKTGSAVVARLLLQDSSCRGPIAEPGGHMDGRVPSPMRGSRTVRSCKISGDFESLRKLKIKNHRNRLSVGWFSRECPNRGCHCQSGMRSRRPSISPTI